MRVRNPFRVIVAALGAGRARCGPATPTRSSRLAGTKYQLWAIPVSLRARKRANRRVSRAAAGQDGRGGRTAGLGAFGGGPGRGGAAAADGSARAASDRAMEDLRDLWEAREKDESAQGEVSVRWAWEILGPAAAGAVVLAILIAVG